MKESQAGPSKLTPVMRQFQDAKQAHPDAIMFFRMGDFYEMFYDDAVTASKLLDLTLTSRNKGNPDEIPMAGVPYHAAHGYIAKLLSNGLKVAICEQMADPSKVKGIVPRAVVRVLTPGLVTDETQLEARANHYLAAVDLVGSRYGVALLDLSTGELLACALDDSPTSLVAELARVEPREVIVSASASGSRSAMDQLLNGVMIRPDADLDESDVIPIISKVIGETALADARGSFHAVALRACARVLRMALSCTPGASLPVQRIVSFDPSSTLQMDEVAQGHLELIRSSEGGKRGSLLSAIDFTKTSAGGRLLRRWLLSPLVDVPAIRRRQDAVEALVTDPQVRAAMRESLGSVGDIERLAVRALLGEASPRDLGVLRDSLVAVPDVVSSMGALAESGSRQVLGVEGEQVDLVEDLRERLVSALVDRPPALARDGGIFREGFDQQIDETGGLQREGANLIVALEAELRQSTGIATLKVRYTRVFGWYIEVTRAQAGKAAAAWRRKQTVAGGERYTCDELDELADRLLHAEERHSQRESELFQQLVREVAGQADRLRVLGAKLAFWDVVGGLAELAHTHDYRRPLIDDSEVIEIQDGRHPVVERLAAAGRFVPNDVALDTSGQRLWLITGPNMAGKSTLMRQVALIVILAQMGSFVPVQSARIGVVDRVLSRVGASDNVSRGESTFMVEMRETASILRQATRRSFVILDEIGRGTSTYDGLAIAWAVAEHLHDVVGCRTMFATHYHELTELTNVAKNAANYSVSARELGDEVVFLYKLVHGAASRSYGVAVARLAGVPETVLVRARTILGGLETGTALPGGRYSTMRGRSKSGGVQLDLFAPAIPELLAPSPVLKMLEAIEPDRLSPMDALQLLIKLKSMAAK